MGGRGGSSGISAGGSFNYQTFGSAGEYKKEANEVISGVKTVLADFGMESELKAVSFVDKIKGDGMGVDGFGELSISKSYLANKGKSSEGYFASDTFNGAGAHEAAHVVCYSLLKNKVMSGSSRDETSMARKGEKLEKAIIKEAKNRYGSNPKISGYGSTKFSEKVAEAVSDVYSNGRKANPYSKEIVKVMKDIKSGKFVPKI